jgi:hypothetical protein
MGKIIIHIKKDKKESFIKMINSIIKDENVEIKLFQTQSIDDNADSIIISLIDNVNPYIPFLIGFFYSQHKYISQ